MHWHDTMRHIPDPAGMDLFDPVSVSIAESLAISPIKTIRLDAKSWNS